MTTLTFQNPFLLSIGLSASEAGYISAAGYIVAALTNPLWGVLADRTGARRMILVFLCVGVCCMFVITPWVANELSTANKANTTTSWSGKQCQNVSILEEGVKTDHVITVKEIMPLGGAAITDAKHVENNSSTLPSCQRTNHEFLFYTMLFLWILIYILLFPIDGLLNSTVMDVLKSSSTTQTFGQQRLYGSIGAGAASFLGGIAADKFVHPTLSKYSIAFFLLGPSAIMSALMAFLLFRCCQWKRVQPITEAAQDIPVGNGTYVVETQRSVQRRENRLKVMLSVFKNVSNTIIMLTALIQGTLLNTYGSFLFLMIVDELNGSKTSMGFSDLISCVFEAIMFFFTNATIRFFRGPINCVEVCLLSWIIRFLACSYIENPWLIALPQTLHALGYALFEAAMVQHIHDISPKEVKTTMFTLFTSLQCTGGGFLANVIGGPVYAVYGGRVLFKGATTLGSVWLLGLILNFHGGFLLKKLFLCSPCESI